MTSDLGVGVDTIPGGWRRRRTPALVLRQPQYRCPGFVCTCTSFHSPPWSILVAGGLNLGRSKRRVGLEALGAVSKLATVKHKFVKRNPWLANRKTPVAAMPLAGDSVVLLTAGGGYVSVSYTHLRAHET